MIAAYNVRFGLLLRCVVLKLYSASKSKTRPNFEIFDPVSYTHLTLPTIYSV